MDKKINMLFKYGIDNLEFYLSPELACGNISVVSGWQPLVGYEMIRGEYYVYTHETVVTSWPAYSKPVDFPRQDSFRLKEVKLRVRKK